MKKIRKAKQKSRSNEEFENTNQKHNNVQFQQNRTFQNNDFNHNNRQNSQTNSKRKRKNSDRDMSKMKCYECHKMNHYQNDCTKKHL